MQWARLNPDGTPSGFFGEAPENGTPPAPDMVIVPDAAWRDYLENQPNRHFVQDAEGNWTAEPFVPPPPPLAELKRAKAVQFTILMDGEIRSLLGLSAEDSEILPDYLEVTLVLQTNPSGANTIWQHYRSKVAEIRAAADQSALDAINWRP